MSLTKIQKEQIKSLIKNNKFAGLSSYLSWIKGLDDLSFNEEEKILAQKILFQYFTIYAGTHNEFYNNTEIIDFLRKHKYDDQEISCCLQFLSPTTLLQIIDHIYPKALWQRKINYLFKNDNIREIHNKIKLLNILCENDIKNYRSTNGNNILHIAFNTYNTFYEYNDLNFISNIAKEYPSLLTAVNNDGVPPIWEICDLQLEHLIPKEYSFDSLDAYGSSILHYAIENGNTNLCNVLLLKGCKDIRGGQLDRNTLQIKAALNQPIIESDIIKNDLNYADIEQGKTALHYAILLKHYDIAKFLVDRNSDFLMTDKANNSALDYAILMGNLELVDQILNKASEEQLTASNKYPFSYLMKAAYSANKDVYALIKNKIKPKYDIELLLDKIVQEQALDFKEVQKLSLIKQRILLNSVAQLLPKIHDQVMQYMRTQLLSRENYGKFDPGTAYGIELEISNFYSSFVFSSYIENNFYATTMQDASVKHSIFNSNDISEIVSEIIDSNAKLENFLSLASELSASNVITNKTTGLHVHVNIRGNNKELTSITKTMSINNLETEKVELAVVKQILINWQLLEPLFQGVMRGGDMYDLTESNEHYALPLLSLTDELIKCDNLEDIIKFSDRCKALNCSSLATTGEHGHGTLEFRMHEGSVNPILINAWLNLIHRLVKISIDQVQSFIDSNNTQALFSKFTPQPFENITDLFYIMIAERDYNQTWNKELRAPKYTSVPPAILGSINIINKIIESEVYVAFRKCKLGIPIDDATQNMSPIDKKIVTDMLNLTARYPGLKEEYERAYNIANEISHSSSISYSYSKNSDKNNKNNKNKEEFQECINFINNNGFTVTASTDFSNIDDINFNKSGHTPLTLATSIGDYEMCKKMLNVFNTDVNRANKYGNTPLHVALYNYKDNNSENFKKIISLFLENNNVLLNIPNNDNQTAIDLAKKMQIEHLLSNNLGGARPR